MNGAAVRILHAEPGPDGGVLERWLGEARASNADWLRSGFIDAGVADVAVVSGPLDDTPFGARLRALVEGLGTAGGPGEEAGLVVLGSGAIPRARPADFRALALIARSGEARALVNNRYSADVVAIGRAGILRAMPDLPGDNALPRWLEEVAGVRVDDLRRRARLQMDIDSPMDVLVVDRGAAPPREVDVTRVRKRMRALRDLAADRRAELLVAGRTSATTIRWLERATACRVRALIEERGLRASTPAAMAPGEPGPAPRPARSVLGLLLDDRGPEAMGAAVAELSDGAVIDTRVLLAHRLGPDEGGWPSAEDRFASDLLLPDRIVDRWLQALTASALAASGPILLGGHSLVGPGIRLLLGRSGPR